MNDNTPLEGFLDHVLNDPSLQEDLSQEDLVAMRSVFSNLLSEIPGVAKPVSKKPIDLTELLDGEIIEDIPFDNALNTKSDAELLQYMADQVDGSIRVINVLCQRSTAWRSLPEVGRLELQFLDAAWGIYDTQQTMTQPSSIRRSQTWQYRLKKLLLREFHFINRWFRGMP